MDILIKTTLRNIIGKPFRSLLVIFSIFVCSMTALFCFDIARTESVFFDVAFKVMAGEGDISVVGENVDLSVLPADFPEYDYMDYRVLTEFKYNDIEGEYYVAHVDRVRVTSVDITQAGIMDIVPAGLELGDGQVIVTQGYADTYECGIGDTITLHDKHGDPVELEVVNIVPTGTMNVMRRGRSCIVNENTGDMLLAGTYQRPGHMMNIHDDSQVTPAMNMLKEIFPDANVVRLTASDSMMESSREFMGLMFMVFAIAFLLVIFITASLCERIVSERMSYIGTLRSLGLSARSTGLILLLENVFYALIGSLPGTIIYCIFRDTIMSGIYTTSSDISNDVIPALSPLVIIGVILGAVVIECVIPLRAQFKALKVSIRDIIFDNRDTEYKMSRTTIVLGFAFAVVGVIAFILRTDLFAAAACLIAVVMAVAFLYPLILKGITSFMAARMRKADKECLALASIETGSRKSSVGSGILSVSSSAMCVIILSIALSMMGSLNVDKYACDVVVETTSDAAHYAFADRMDGITETELLYGSTDDILVQSELVSAEVYGMPEDGFTMYNGFSQVPALSDGMIAVDSAWAKRSGIVEGDVITMTFNPDSVFPIVKEFTVAGTFINLDRANAEVTLITSLDDYIAIYHDSPSKLLIRCDDPADIVSKIKTYAVGLYDEVQTADEIRAKAEEDNRTSMIIFTSIIAVALGMTAIGMASNQLIGFEGRRKECAVMLSTAMTRETLVSILFRESLLSAVISGTLGLLTGSLLVLVIRDALANTRSLYINIVYNPLYTLLLWLGMIVLFALTVLFPISSLKKMKISEQIKCD